MNMSGIGRGTCGGLVLALIAATTAVFCSAPLGAVDRTSADGKARAGRNTHIYCLSKDGSEYVRRYRPHHCAAYSKPRGGSFGGGVNLKHLHWRSWGGGIARARGIECGFHLPCAHIKARIKASVKRQGCGGDVYTRIRAKTKFGTSNPRLPRCHTSAF
jgi:hypothetical protein